MSTIVYAMVTSRRLKAQPNTSYSEQPPGIGTYLDTLAALVPAEVLGLHAIILTFTTRIEAGQTVITAPCTLSISFAVLIGLCILLYAVGRIGERWQPWDWFRVFIPPLGFIGWTMLQRTTAFDAVLPGLPEAPRMVIATVGAVVLGIAASVLARLADRTPPRR